MPFMPRFSIDYSGPIFTGQSEELIERFVKNAEKDIAEHGVDMIQNQYAKVFRYKYPSKHKGQARAAVRNRMVNGHHQLQAGNIVYGAWLEGTGSRNSRTRFKGYRTFRLVGQQLQDRAVRMAEVILQPYLRKLNGK